MNDYFYETGSTQPPKSRVWFVLLLVVLIFIGGVLTALSILNIKLLHTLTPDKEEAVTLRFTREETTAVASLEDPLPNQVAPRAGLGVDTETVSPFIRAYYRLPQGVYVPRVPENSNAAKAGILPGDIILALDGEEITDTNTLDTHLRRYAVGDNVRLALYRDGKQLFVEFTLEQGD